MAKKIRTTTRNDLMRDRIRQTAGRLFAARGISAVTLQDLADEVGISKPAVYHYFTGKEDLIRAVFSDWAKERLNDLLAAIATVDTPGQRLKRFVTTHVHSVASDLDLFRMSFRSEESLPDEVRAEFRLQRRDADLALRGLIQAGIAEGEFDPVDPKLAAFAIFGMINWMVGWFNVGDKASVDDIAAFMVNMISNGLKRRSISAKAFEGSAASAIVELAQRLDREVDELRASKSALEAEILLIRDACPALPQVGKQAAKRKR
jgi:AcrR family transcriptional regulator